MITGTPFDEVWNGQLNYNPRGKDTAKLLKQKGIKSPKGKMIKIDKKTWKIETKK